MDIQKKRDFLINCAYWAVIIAGAYLALEYLLPVFMPCILGVLLAWLVVWISGKLHCKNRVFRIVLSVLIYGVIGLLIAWAVVRGVDAVSGLIQWLPQVYEKKLQPLVMLVYNWGVDTLEHLDPALLSALESVFESLLSGLKNLVSSISGFAVNLVSGLATGIPSLIFSLLTMIFSTIFVVADYERIASFTSENLPQSVKRVLKNIRIYLTDTLFVVIRSYVLIMLLTFTELSILFSVFGIENAVLKAAVIAVLDIMPILGTGGIMIPWAVISLVLGYTKLGIELFVIYGIVTVIRNYVEPKIVGTQLGLHPIITLVAMFVGLRLFGFWGLFGLPVGISFLWKQKMEKQQTASA
ncbi:MAG: AI-2E family transporter [Ruminococcaceae bacterium]|nr:AI-2E family transporter [Oscillospiraceae bacterium]MBE6980582.1 AI-2E family transporter [Oscillospiraceae bacterium]